METCIQSAILVNHIDGIIKDQLDSKENVEAKTKFWQQRGESVILKNGFVTILFSDFPEEYQTIMISNLLDYFTNKYDISV